MRIRLGVPHNLSGDEKQDVLDAALESVTRANEGLIARGLPTFRDAVDRVRWRPEPPGDEHFDLGSTVIRRGWGDCDDLAPWHAASLRATGEDPHARAIVVPSASGVPGRWHAIVERSQGDIDDPSIEAGMGEVSGDHYRGPFWAAMRPDRLAMATYPLAYGGYAGRVDVPSESVPAVYSGLATGNTRAAALCGAIGPLADVCGDDTDESLLASLAGVHDLLLGVSPDEVCAALEQVYGDVVGFLPALAMAAPFATDIAKGALGKILPGGGGGGRAAQEAQQGGGAGVHLPGYYGAPIIVRF